MAKTTTKKYKTCFCCGIRQGIYNFYADLNPKTSTDGKMRICKGCLQSLILDDNNVFSMQKFKDTLQRLDKPFLPHILEKCYTELEEKKKEGHTGNDNTLIGLYFKAVNGLSRYRSMSFDDSVELSETQFYDLTKAKAEIKKAEKGKGAGGNKEQSRKEIAKFNGDFSMFKPAPEDIKMFGGGLTNQEYQLMHDKYDQLLQDYSVKTAMHREFLIDYVRFKVKEDIALANGDVEGVKKWHSLASSIADQAKLTPKQLTAADLQGGISTFGEIFEAVESAADIIEILPRFKQAPNDMVDFVLWNYINYERDLNGLPHVSYKDVYAFYDKMKEDYLKEHGDMFHIFDNDMTQEPAKREIVQKFIGTESVVQEPSPEEGDS